MITSAGAVLAGTFAMLGTPPLVIFAEIGSPDQAAGRTVRCYRERSGGTVTRILDCG